MERPRNDQKITDILQNGISSATHEKPFYIGFQNPQFINLDSLNGLIPQKAQVLALIKRDKRRKTPDHLLVRVGPYLSGEMTYAAFPISAIIVEGNALVIDCSSVIKEQVFTTFPNFFANKPLN